MISDLNNIRRDLLLDKCMNILPNFVRQGTLTEIQYKDIIEGIKSDKLKTIEDVLSFLEQNHTGVK